MRALGVVVLAVSLGIVIVLAVYADGVYYPRTFGSVTTVKGTVTSGNLASLTAKDNNDYNVTSTGGGSSTVIYQFVPNRDNVTDKVNWASNCNLFFYCLNEVPYTDGNVTIVWSGSSPNNFSVGFQQLSYLYGGRTVTDVRVHAVVRGNVSGSPVNITLRDPVASLTCSTVVPLTGLAWAEFVTGAATTCAGELWTGSVVDRLEARFAAPSSNVVVSTVWLFVTTTSTPFYAVVYANATLLPTTQVPTNVQYSCARSILLGPVTLYAWSRTSGGYVAIATSACPVGIPPAVTNVTLASDQTWTTGNSFSVRVVSDAMLSAGALIIDQLTFSTNYTAAPPSVYNLTGENWSWVFLLGFLIAGGFLIAYYVRKWEDGGL